MKETVYYNEQNSLHYGGRDGAEGRDGQNKRNKIKRQTSQQHIHVHLLFFSLDILLTSFVYFDEIPP